MKPELKKELLNTLLQIKDFTSEQLPLTAHDIIRYGIISSLFWAFVSLVVIAGCIKLIGIMLQESSDESFMSITFNVCALLIFIFTIVLLCQVDTFLAAKYAPRAYMIYFLKAGS